MEGEIKGCGIFNYQAIGAGELGSKRTAANFPHTQKKYPRHFDGPIAIQAEFSHYSPTTDLPDMTQKLPPRSPLRLALLATAAAAAAAWPGAAQAQFRQEITNDPSQCYAGSGPAVMIQLREIREGGGNIRVQLYRGIASDWLETGRWISRIEVPARAGTMNFCMPVPRAGTYAIAIRHDINGNGKTDITQDGGGMSNNPSLNIFNLGKPSYRKTAFEVGNDVKSIAIRMRYF